jgi:hypothetical protein
VVLDLEKGKRSKKIERKNKSLLFYRDENISGVSDFEDDSSKKKNVIRKYFRSLKHFAETPRVHFWYDVVRIILLYLK